MSAFGPKRTFLFAPQMSAFGKNLLQNSVALDGGSLAVSFWQSLFRSPIEGVVVAPHRSNAYYAAHAVA
jgi:hypothetical protein